MQKLYRPYLIHRVECQYDPDSPGINALCDYDYMGSAEYEFGAIGRSTQRTRDAITAGEIFHIIKIPLLNPVTTPDGIHDHMFVMVSDKNRAQYGVSFYDRIRDLIDGNVSTKERCSFDGNFAMWHDLEADIYFSFNATFLRLVYCILARDIHFAKHAHRELLIGDTLTVAKVLNGRALRSVNHMETKTGKIVGIIDNAVVIKDYKKYRMPFEYILTHDVKILAPYEEVNS